ncbi:AAA family ATPase [uncultured Anaerococcus sp.]|uniref:AAA family ATPase n=1 Tax=uncultured Anaerococcus sp. TaxID=293428 RepID=UPI00280BB632|nr:AAA family ATPase [uncultured Anaerococcus sp.]MDU5149878.1 AAA family ATPase [Anaerococcus prevotii]
MIKYLQEEKIDENLIKQLEEYRKNHGLPDNDRVIKPEYKYYGKEVLEQAIAALLAGKNILLTGAKATGKNVLSSNLSYLFQRPTYNVSFHVNTDSASLIGADTFKNGEVVFRKGPITEAAENGGFAILDEINMAKNEAISVLHATLDHRRIIDLSGYDKIALDPNTRFIATMNYGYVGTRELNEALSSRFMIINVPNITSDNLDKLLADNFPTLKEKYRKAFIDLFISLQTKSENNEISTKSVDLRGLIGAIETIKIGLSPYQALMMGLVNKSFDEFERQIVLDTLKSKIPTNITESVFDE